jgi:hypothetical protein
VPKDAVSFSASRFDVSSVYATIEDGLEAYDPEIAQLVLQFVAAFEEELGVSIKNDLFGALGDEIVTWSMPMAAFGTAPELAVLVKVRDQEKLLATVQKLSKLSRGAVEIDEVNRRGITVYQVRLDLDTGGGMGFNPMDMFVPTFGFKDGYMVVGFSTGDVKSVFGRMDREDDPSGDIRSNPEFQPYFAEIPKQGITSLAFTDWKAQFEGFYQLATSVLALIPLDDEIPVNFALLPDSMTLTQHLYGSVTWGSTDDSGMRSTTISPFGPEIAAILGVMVGAGMWLTVAAGG